MIEVGLGALLELEVRLVAIVRVVLDRDAATLWHRRRELVRDGGLAGAGASGDSHDERTCHGAELSHKLMLAVTRPIINDVMWPRTWTTVPCVTTSILPTESGFVFLNT